MGIQSLPALTCRIPQCETETVWLMWHSVQMWTGVRFESCNVCLFSFALIGRNRKEELFPMVTHDAHVETCTLWGHIPTSSPLSHLSSSLTNNLNTHPPHLLSLSPTSHQSITSHMVLILQPQNPQILFDVSASAFKTTGRGTTGRTAGEGRTCWSLTHTHTDLPHYTGGEKKR